MRNFSLFLPCRGQDTRGMVPRSSALSRTRRTPRRAEEPQLAGPLARRRRAIRPPRRRSRGPPARPPARSPAGARAARERPCSPPGARGRSARCRCRTAAATTTPGSGASSRASTWISAQLGAGVRQVHEPLGDADAGLVVTDHRESNAREHLGGAGRRHMGLRVGLRVLALPHVAQVQDGARRLRAGDAVRGKAGVDLELADRALGEGAEDAVDRAAREAEDADARAGAARTSAPWKCGTRR